MCGRRRSGTTGCIEFRSVFETLGLTPTEEMRARAQRLDQIASHGIGAMTLVCRIAQP